MIDPVPPSTASHTDETAIGADSPTTQPESVSRPPLTADVVRQAEAVRSDCPQKQVLLITDDRVFGQEVTSALERLGYNSRLLHTSDPAVATQQCAQQKPDLVLLNIDALSLGGL